MFQFLAAGAQGSRVLFTSTQKNPVNKPEKIVFQVTPSPGKRMKSIIIETLWNLEGQYPAFVFYFRKNPYFNQIPLPQAISAQLADSTVANGLIVNTDFVNSPTRRVDLDLEDCGQLEIYNVGDPNTPSQVIFTFQMG